MSPIVRLMARQWWDEHALPVRRGYEFGGIALQVTLECGGLTPLSFAVWSFPKTGCGFVGLLAPGRCFA